LRKKSAVLGVAKVQLRLDAAVVNIALGQAIADQHDALAFLRRSDGLRPGGGGGGRLRIGACGALAGAAAETIGKTRALRSAGRRRGYFMFGTEGD
jgi:hypothetical protein